MTNDQHFNLAKVTFERLCEERFMQNLAQENDTEPRSGGWARYIHPRYAQIARLPGVFPFGPGIAPR